MAEEPKPDARRRRHPAISAKARAVFLEAVAAGWSVTHAAERAGVARQRCYERAESDEAFAAAWRAADESGLHVLEDEIRRRAVDGVEEPVFQGGVLIGHVRRYSDTLLMFLTKKKDPSYRENSQVTVSGSVRHELDISDALERFNRSVRMLSRDQLALPPGETLNVDVDGGDEGEGDAP